MSRVQSTLLTLLHEWSCIQKGVWATSAPLQPGVTHVCYALVPGLLLTLP